MMSHLNKMLVLSLLLGLARDAAAAVSDPDTPFFQEIMPALEPMGKRSIAKVMESVPGFEAALMPMLLSTPKNEDGNFGRSTVRYIMNRFFIQRHGWFVNGLFTGGAKWNASLEGDLSFVDEVVPLAARHMFEESLGRRGLDAKQLALLGSIIEERILGEARDVLRSSYKLMGVSTTANVTRPVAHTLLSIHMMRQITQADDSVCTPKYGGKFQVRCLQTVVEQVDPNWPKTQKFLSDLQEELVPSKTVALLDFESVALVATAVESRWGKWTAKRNCLSIKDKMIKIEEGHNTGCVRLSAFYERSLNPTDGWQFKETQHYLRQLGALDETTASDPKILIPNYVNALGNCFSSGKYYQSCCISECEDLQVHLEEALQSSAPKPEQILDLVKHMSSATMRATGTLSLALRRHLEEIAELHGGRVPLQGRLFAQWMHFAYPHECPYPHMSGSTQQVGLNLNSDAQFVTDSVVFRVITEGHHLNHTDTTGTCMHWRREEELFVPTEPAWAKPLGALEEDAGVWSLVHAMALFSTFGLLATTVMTSLRSLRKGVAAKRVELKHCFLV